MSTDPSLHRFGAALPWRHALAWFALAAAPAARASYGQMKLDGVVFFFAATFLYAWGILLAMGLALGGRKYKAFAVVASVVTALLAALLIASLHDGASTLQPRPLRMGAMFVVLLLAAVPVMLAAPIWQRAQHLRGQSSRLSLAVLVVAVLLPPAGSVLHLLTQERMANRAVAQARALAPGGLLPHVAASQQRAAESWLSPYLWNEAEASKRIIVGVSDLAFIESPVPLSAEDTQALERLLAAVAGDPYRFYTWKVEGKLAWDRLMRAAPAERVAVAARLTRAQADHLVEFIGVPHADWLCALLAEEETRKAFDKLWSLLADGERQRFAAAVRAKCGGQAVGPAR